MNLTVFLLVGLVWVVFMAYFVSHPSMSSKQPCVRVGCNGDICTDRTDLATTCLWNECRASCYNTYTVCKRVNNRCMFVQKDDFSECLASCPS